jgi:cytochrome P450
MDPAEEVEARPILAAPPRPARPLSTLQIMRVAFSNTLAACDQELFEELFVERRHLWHPVFIISDPEGIRRVLQDNCDNYPRLDQIRRMFAFTSGAGMLYLEGEASRQHRRLLNPALDHRAVLSAIPRLIELTVEAARLMAEMPPGQEIDIGDTLTHWLTVTTGHVFTGGDREIEPLLYRLGQFPGRYTFFDFMALPGPLRLLARFGRSRREARQFLPLLDRLFAERRGDSETARADLLGRLAHARDRRTGEGLGTAELRDEALTLASTAATPLRPLTWIWYLLATHPAVEAKLHAELDRVLGDRTPSVDDLFRLDYTRMVIEETMRLYPPLPIMLRSAVAEDVVCGRRIPRNAVVAILPWVVHRHRQLWRNPDVFDPERFAAEQVAERSRYAYLPFSVGPHVCIGASLAMSQMLMAVAILAQRFRFSLAPGHPVEPTAWTNLRPKDGIKVTVEPRAARPGRAALRREEVGAVPSS